MPDIHRRRSRPPPRGFDNNVLTVPSDFVILPREPFSTAASTAS